ncbi:MAG: FG-GAP-like repeat-containing protein, partial [Verrucomicrobiales bacterium]
MQQILQYWALCLGTTVAIFSVGCDGGRDADPEASDGRPAKGVAPVVDRSKMDEILVEIRESDLVGNQFFGKGEILDLEAKLQARGAAMNPRERLETQSQLGMAYLNYGEISKGIEAFEAVYRTMTRMGAPDGIRAQAAFDLGLAYFRLAETENCCAINAPESCILPLRGAAVHTKRHGSEMALEYFAEAAELEAGDPQLLLKATWFVNLAAMTLGDFPDAVPDDLRMPEQLFEPEGAAPRFLSVAAELGVDWESLAGGVLVEDFDGDGDLDLVVSSFDSAEPMRYYENRGGNGGFVERSQEAGFSRSLGGLNLVQADYDNDGDVDFLVLRGGWLRNRGRHPNSLMRNEGDGVFRDVTFSSGLGEGYWPTQTAAWADYDNDGDLDLYVGNETADGFDAPCQLFRNEGDGTFVDVAEAAGVANRRWAKGVAWGDFDGDRFPDLVVSNYNGANRMYRNGGDGTFEDVATETGTMLPKKSFPVWTWDFNNDGRLDFFVSSYNGNVSTHVLYSEGGRLKGLDLSGHYRGNGRGGFENVALAAGVSAPMITMGCSVGDLDNDGWVDFYLGTGVPNIEVVLPNQLFMNQGGNGFGERTMASGLGHLQKGHAVAFADLDEDGDLDI